MYKGFESCFHYKLLANKTGVKFWICALLPGTITLPVAWGSLGTLNGPLLLTLPLVFAISALAYCFPVMMYFCIAQGIGMYGAAPGFYKKLKYPRLCIAIGISLYIIKYTQLPWLLLIPLAMIFAYFLDAIFILLASSCKLANREAGKYAGTMARCEKCTLTCPCRRVYPPEVHK
jgi:hypothetical protein